MWPVKISLYLLAFSLVFGATMPASATSPTKIVKYRVEGGVKVYRNEVSPGQQQANQIRGRMLIQIEANRAAAQRRAHIQAVRIQDARRAGFREGLAQARNIQNRRTAALRRICLGQFRPTYRNTRRSHNARLGCRRFYERPVRVRQRIRSIVRPQ